MFTEPTPGSLADLGPEADAEQVARTIALRRLESAPRTRAELASTLAKRGVPAPVADAVLDRFTEVGLIDDAAFANAWVTSRHHGRGLGRRALAGELRRKGVDPELVAQAIDQIDGDDERERAVALAHRKAPGLAHLPQEKALHRLVGHLTRKGYAPGLAFEVSREVLSEAAASASDRADEAEPGDADAADDGGR